MARISDDEKREFHQLLDNSLEKLDTGKNSKKVHWNKLSLQQLNKMLMIEAHELDLEVINKDLMGVLSECDDIINFAMFIKHNILSGVYNDI